jgi:hypothetical protein
MLVVLAPLAAFCVAWGAPAVMIEPSTFDWGRQAENKGEYAYAFKVTNVGNEELQIASVRPGCSCTKVALKKQNLAPGESTEMTGSLSTKDIEGTLRKVIVLVSNDPTNPSAMATLAIRFPINGTGLRMKMAPSPVRLQPEGFSAHVVVENCEPDTVIRIEAMELPEGWGSLAPLPIEVSAEDHIDVIITGRVKPGAAGQAFDGVPFTVITSSPKTPRVQGTLTYRPAPPAPAPVAPAVPAGTPPSAPQAVPAPPAAPPAGATPPP